MSITVQIAVLPRQQEDLDYILELALKKQKLRRENIGDWRIRKRSIDARQRPIKINLQIEMWPKGEKREVIPAFIPKNVVHSKKNSYHRCRPSGFVCGFEGGGSRPKTHCF